jgi:hypothetical protein
MDGCFVEWKGYGSDGGATAVVNMFAWFHGWMGERMKGWMDGWAKG